ncbi:HAD-IA family hydrolase [Actinophytocola oryzae]|uniref:Sugar-phosphatase n=1 Tax=Actinophytocola oryzae TaxID=502181 RepID=A0A4R7VW17_9PSEU|nr:HAD-IA family hydrolase [Actinophytocola oryzae]TDV54236.1 sugar-phosphatase [Actinophytocola oryzae]
MTAEFQAVLFDMDGTLIDSTTAVRRAWRRWADEEGIEVARLAGTSGRPARRIVTDLVPPERVEQSLARYTHIATHDLDGVAVLPGTPAALDATAEHHAIVTSSSRDVTTARMAAARLPLPEVVVTAEDVADGKPHPAAYLLAAARLGVDPRRCLVVEDTDVGVTAGVAAGCPVLGVGPRVTADAGVLALVPDLSTARFAATADGVAVSFADRMAA